MLEAIQNAYALLDQMQISVTGLIVAAVVFSLAFLFAVREAAAWFFKIDDLKRDVRRLRKNTQHLEGEIKLLQTLILKMKEPLAEAPSIEMANSSRDDEAKTAFPITH